MPRLSDKSDNQNTLVMALGVVFPLAFAGGVFALFPGWPAVIVGALAIVVTAVSATRLTTERGG